MVLLDPLGEIETIAYYSVAAKVTIRLLLMGGTTTLLW